VDDFEVLWPLFRSGGHFRGLEAHSKMCRTFSRCGGTFKDVVYIKVVWWQLKRCGSSIRGVMAHLKVKDVWWLIYRCCGQKRGVVAHLEVWWHI